MITCLILNTGVGMGMPMIANDIVTSSIAGPALLALGVPLLVSRMFVFFFGMLGRPHPTCSAGLFCRGAHCQERRAGDLDPGHQGGGGRVRDSVRDRVLVGTDAAKWRPAGSRVGTVSGRTSGCRCCTGRCRAPPDAAGSCAPLRAATISTTDCASVLSRYRSCASTAAGRAVAAQKRHPDVMTGACVRLDQVVTRLRIQSAVPKKA